MALSKFQIIWTNFSQVLDKIKFYSVRWHKVVDSDRPCHQVNQEDRWAFLASFLKHHRAPTMPTFQWLMCNPYVPRGKPRQPNLPCDNQEKLISANIKSARYLHRIQIMGRLWIISLVAHPFWYNSNCQYTINRLLNYLPWCKKWPWMPTMEPLLKLKHKTSNRSLVRLSNHSRWVKQYSFRPINLKNRKIMT